MLDMNLSEGRRVVGCDVVLLVAEDINEEVFRNIEEFMMLWVNFYTSPWLACLAFWNLVKLGQTQALV